MSGTGTGTPVDSTSQAYATVAELKERLGISVSTWDTLLGTLITVASRSIDNDTQRVFYTTQESRSFDGKGETTLLIDDIITLDSATVDGDAVVAGTDFNTFPYNFSPKYELIGIDGYTFTNDAKNVVVTGNWGFADSIPSVINQITLERASRYWQQKGQDMMKSEKLGDYEYERFGIIAFSKFDDILLKPYTRLELI